MKKLISIAMMLFSITSYAQTNFSTKEEVKEALKNGYKTPSGWLIKEGDRIQIGQGSTGNKKFAYIYEGPGITLSTAMTPLPSNWSNKMATVKQVTYTGTKKTGFTPVVVVGVGLIVNYHIQIDNAIESGEVVLPKEYAKKDAEQPTSSSSLADELKKLKELLDAGAITQTEYDIAKKKLLDQ